MIPEGNEQLDLKKRLDQNERGDIMRALRREPYRQTFKVGWLSGRKRRS